MLRPRKRITKKEIKRDALLDVLFQVQKYYEAKKSRVWTILGTIVAVVAITWTGLRWKSASEDAASTMLGKGLLSYEQGNYEEAIRQLEPILSEYPATHSGIEANVYIGIISLQQGKTSQARHYFEVYLDDGDNPILLSGSLGLIASAYESEKQYNLAGEYYQEAAQKSIHRFQKRRFEINAALNWIRVGEYDRAEEMLASLDDESDLPQEVKDKVDELRGRLDVTTIQNQ